MAEFKRFEVEDCECGHTVPLEFIRYDENSSGTCITCVNDDLIFRLGKKNKRIKKLNTKIKEYAENNIPKFNNGICKETCNCIEIAEAENGGEPVKNYPCLGKSKECNELIKPHER